MFLGNKFIHPVISLPWALAPGLFTQICSCITHLSESISVGYRLIVYHNGMQLSSKCVQTESCFGDTFQLYQGDLIIYEVPAHLFQPLSQEVNKVSFSALALGDVIMVMVL